MNYEEFLEYIKKSMQEFYGSEVRVTINHITKNNGVGLDGLTIMETGKNISPTIYLNAYFEEYRHGRASSEIVALLIAIYEKVKCEVSIDISFFTDFERVKSKLVYKLVNYAQNQELLSKMPHRRILDLAMVYYCLVENDLTGGATILVHNSHLALWNIEENVLYELAKKNTELLLPAKIISMTDILYEMAGENVQDRLLEEVNREDSEGMIRELIEEIEESRTEIPMFVLSNQYRVQGAACMLYQNLLGKFAEKHKADLFIIPSSVHEVILVPVDAYVNGQKLFQMLNEVNDTHVAKEEVLSGQLYRYDRKQDSLNPVEV